MKLIVWMICVFNICMGLHYLLNALHLLQNSKLSQTATVVLAVLFLCMGMAAVYICLYQNNYRLALLIGFGPWAIALLVLLLNMLMGDYR